MERRTQAVRRQDRLRRSHDSVFSSSPFPKAPKDHINIRILQIMISGIPLILGLGTRMSCPYVYVVLWAPIYCHTGPFFLDLSRLTVTVPQKVIAGPHYTFNSPLW